MTGESWGGDTTGTDIVTIKYDNSGNQKWAKRYDGVGHQTDYPVGIVADKTGNAYVAGATSNSETDKDIVLIKYDPSGKRLWVKTYGGAAKKDDSVSTLAIDVDGSLYLVGSVFSKTVEKKDIATLVIFKYTPSGPLFGAKPISVWRALVLLAAA